jgi:hypothetical protein
LSKTKNQIGQTKNESTVGQTNGQIDFSRNKNWLKIRKKRIKIFSFDKFYYRKISGVKNSAE